MSEFVTAANYPSGRSYRAARVDEYQAQIKARNYLSNIDSFDQKYSSDEIATQKLWLETSESKWGRIPMPISFVIVRMIFILVGIALVAFLIVLPFVLGDAGVVYAIEGLSIFMFACLAIIACVLLSDC